MSTVQQTAGLNSPQPVILKGFKDEPIEILAISDRGDSIEVVHEMADDPMPYHVDSVFEYDQKLFAELKRAAEQNDERRLRATWERATPFRKTA
jgi:hypothetical protein